MSSSAAVATGLDTRKDNATRFSLGGAAHSSRRGGFAVGVRAGERKTCWAKGPSPNNDVIHPAASARWYSSISAEGVGLNVESSHLGVGDLDALIIGVFDEMTGDGEPGISSSAGAWRGGSRLLPGCHLLYDALVSVTLSRSSDGGLLCVRGGDGLDRCADFRQHPGSAWLAWSARLAVNLPDRGRPGLTACRDLSILAA
jgi:hypothetical protein